jgi:hypothetical protein
MCVPCLLGKLRRIVHIIESTHGWEEGTKMDVRDAAHDCLIELAWYRIERFAFRLHNKEVP